MWTFSEGGLDGPASVFGNLFAGAEGDFLHLKPCGVRLLGQARFGARFGTKDAGGRCSSYLKVESMDRHVLRVVDFDAVTVHTHVALWAFAGAKAP